MTTTPRGSPELAAAQAVPETTVNEQTLRTEGGANYYTVADRVTAPPGSCANGAQYLVIATATGAFASKENQIAQAVGANAASGWLYRTPGTLDEGMEAYVQSTDVKYRWSGSAWAVVTGAGSGDLLSTNNLSDVANAATARSNLGVTAAIAAAVAGLSWKQAVRAATNATGTLSTAYENGDTIDGVTLATGDRILIKNQSSGAENGIYTVNASGAPTRATDADSGAELVNATCYVSEGTVNADTQWTCTTNATITVGSTALVFAQLSSGGGISTASTTEVLTGTDTAKAVTPDSLAALWEQGSDVASSGTISLGEGGFFHVTGTTTITDIDFATDKAGRTAWVEFTGALTLTHNASTLILPTSANITTVAGDTACFVSEGSDVVRCVAYQRKSGAALVGNSSSGAVQTLTDGATVTIDASTGNNFRWTIGGNRTFANPTNPTDGQQINVRIIQDGTGGRTWTLGSKFKFSGGAPLLSIAAGAKDFISCQYDVTDDTWFCAMAKGMG